jgi:hypothetical protein
MAKAKANTDWKVIEHGPLEQLAENLWWVLGAIPGLPFERNMVVARQQNGDLVIHNAIALRAEEQAKLEALGTPAHLVVPNGWHRLDAPAYKARYPKLKVWAPKGSRQKVEDVVAVDGTYEDFPSDASVMLRPMPGVKDLEGVMIVHSADGATVVVCDCVFNMPKPPTLIGKMFTTVLGSAPGPRVSRLMKIWMMNDKAAFRGELQRLAALPDLKRFIVAHTRCASGLDAAAALREAASRV